MIGRFLLGSGLGALVGTGLLAMASLVAPAPNGEPRGTDHAPATAPEPTAEPETTPEIVTPAAPQGGTEDSAPVADAGDAAAAPGTGAAVLPLVPEDMPEAPRTTAVAEAEPAVPAEAAAPAMAGTPAAPADLAGDAVPPPAEQPAAAPEGIAALAPDALPGPDESSDMATLPVTAAPDPDTARVPGTDALAEAPASDAAPALVEPSGLPPLTPEEEALLAQIAAEGPGSALPPGEAEPEPALPPAAEPEADAMPETEAPSLLTEAEDERVIRTGEGAATTLPSTPSLTEAVPEGVTVGRLPRIGDPAPADVAADETSQADLRPIAAFARPFDNPEAKPAFAIVLIDEGAADLDRQALAALPFPVTFALDPTDPQAAGQAAIYRAAGQEVVMLATALPKGAQAADVEVAMTAMAVALPETVAVMDLPGRTFQADRPLATLVVPAVWAGGRGLLTWDQGLNAADQVARREAVPAAVVFRDLDGGDERGPVIRRYLDRAAFKAAQDGRVTVVGRARPETVATLLEWAVEGRAATVALAPLTAVLRAN